MDTKRICTVCGKTLAPSAPEGLCPECLLKAGLGTGADIGPDTGDGGKAPRFVPPKIEELGIKFPQWEILEFIGQGGMGAVYKVRQKQLDRIVALKILPPRTGGSTGFAERFTREARALAKLNHQHIVTLYEFGQADGLFYFLMEFVNGVNLRELLNTSRIASKEALAIVPQICEALQFAHDAGIVHRDIKPENILLDKKGQVKIADFGVAKMIAESLTEAAEKTASPSGELTEAGSTLGTPQYMAPEQIKNSAEVDHRADIYSLGVVFYQMLTGELPSGKIEPPSRKVQIDVRLDEIVLRALEKKPELRFQQASDVKTMVETIATTPPPPQTPSPAAPAGWKHYQDSRWGFELDLPAGWSPFPPLYSNSPYEIIRFLSHENGKHALILFRKPHDPAKSLKDAADKAQQHLAKTGFGNFVSSEATIGSQPAHILDFDRPQDGGIWSCREYFLAEGTLGYVVGFGTTDKTNLFETFEHVAQSFRFKTSGYELKNVELSSLGYGQEIIPWFADPKTKTAGASKPPGAAEGTDITPFTSQIIPIEPDLVRLRWQTIVLGLAMAAACLVLGPAARPPVLGWAIATWGVALFIISNLLVLAAGNNRKPLTLAWRIVMVDFAGYLAAEVWCAHLHHLSWQVAVILGSSLAVAWSFRRAAKKGAVQSPCPPPPRGRFLLTILLFAACIIGSGAIVALFVQPFPPTQPPRSISFYATPSVSQILNGPPFIVQLPQATVELAAIGDEPWTNPVCWYPNGQPSPRAFPTGHSDSTSSVLDMNMKKAVFYLRNTGTNGISVPICLVKDNSGVLSEGSIWEGPYKKHPGYFGVDLACPSNLLSANLSLGVANGPWETVVTMEHYNNSISSEGTSGDWDGTYQSVRGTNGDVAVGCSYTTRSNWVSRMIYINGNGDVVPIHETSATVGSQNPATGTLLISSNEYAHIKAFLVQRRKFQWVEFENVSLQTGHLTQVSAQGDGILGQASINASAMDSVRRRFVPIGGMENKTTWGVENHSDFNPDGWAVTANMTIGGMVRIQPWMVAHSQPPANQPPGDDLCHIKLVKGDDDAISLSVSDLSAHNTLSLDLKRDQWTGITVNGVSYRIGYCSDWVAPDEPHTAPYAHVVVTHTAGSEPPHPAPVVASEPEPSFGPTRRVTLNGSTTSFVNLDTGVTLSAYTGRAAELQRWEQAFGIDLAFDKSNPAGLGVIGLLSAGEIANDQWTRITPGDIFSPKDTNLDVGDLATNVFLSAGHTYTFLTRKLSLGIVQVRSVTNHPQEIVLTYKMIQMPADFGPVIERVMDLSDNQQRALNLHSHNYLTPPPQGNVEAFLDSTDALRTAGADLYFASGGEIQALDMHFWDDSNTEEKDVPDSIPDPWVDVHSFPPLLWWISRHPLYGMDTNNPDYLMFSGLYASDRARRLQPHEDSIRGPRVCLFTTRDGVDGILQIADYDSYKSGHTRAIIRYRLIEK